MRLRVHLKETIKGVLNVLHHMTITMWICTHCCQAQPSKRCLQQKHRPAKVTKEIKKIQMVPWNQMFNIAWLGLGAEPQSHKSNTCGFEMSKLAHTCGQKMYWNCSSLQAVTSLYCSKTHVLFVFVNWHVRLATHTHTNTRSKWFIDSSVKVEYIHRAKKQHR